MLLGLVLSSLCLGKSSGDPTLLTATMGQRGGMLFPGFSVCDPVPGAQSQMEWVLHALVQRYRARGECPVGFPCALVQ